jgi:predicted nucleic acid-binding protein
VLLDTNVVSELMRPQPDPIVMGWFAEQAQSQFFISAITRAEILLGIALLPKSKRRDSLATAAQTMFAEDFRDRCLPFDAQAADCYGPLVAARIRAGKPISVEDAQIAAVAIGHNLPLVTKNTKDFANIERMTLINPWHPTP